MSKSLLAAIHNAVAGPSDETLGESNTSAAALHSQTKDDNMSNGNPPAGGDSKPGISQANHDAAVTAARSEGKAEGEKLAADRLTAAMGAEGVKGDAGRMSAALDLAMKSPAMAGADVANFIVTNVPAAGAAAPPKSSTEKYSSERSSAAALAQPGGGDSGATTDFEKGKQKASRFKKP